jgi:hypothetical protein
MHAAQLASRGLQAVRCPATAWWHWWQECGGSGEAALESTHARGHPVLVKAVCTVAYKRLLKLISTHPAFLSPSQLLVRLDDVAVGGVFGWSAEPSEALLPWVDAPDASACAACPRLVPRGTGDSV